MGLIEPYKPLKAVSFLELETEECGCSQSQKDLKDFYLLLFASKMKRTMAKALETENTWLIATKGTGTSVYPKRNWILPTT